VAASRVTLTAVFSATEPKATLLRCLSVATLSLGLQMPRPLALIVPLLGFAAAAAFWLLLSGSDAPPPLPADNATAHGAAAADAAQVDLAASATEAVAGTTGDAAAARDAVGQSSLLPIPDNAVWIEVRTIDADTQQAIPGAAVYWYDDEVTKRAASDAEQQGTTMQWNLSRRDPEYIGTTYGWRTHSDQRGIARVHQTPSTRVVARAGNRYGTASVGRDLLPPRGGHRVVLEIDRELRVQVLDHAGRPVPDIPVAVGGYNADGKQSYLLDWAAQAETSAPDGIASLRHLQRAGEQQGAAGIASWRVLVYVPGLANVSAPFAIEAPPAEPVVLRLPPGGALRVRVEVPATERSQGMVLVSRDRRERSKEDSMYWFDDQRSLSQRVDADGVAYIPWVPLGSSFQVRYSHPQSGLNLTQTIQGPQAADAVIEVVLRPSPEQIQLVGRLLDEQQLPLPNTNGVLQLTGPNLGHHERLRTDADGHFQVRIRRPGNDAKAETIRFQVAREGQPALVAVLPPRPLQAAIEDFGEITMAVEPLVVGGRWSAPGKPRDWRPALRVEAYRERQGKEPEWRRANEQLAHHLDEEGNFAIYGKLPPGRYRLALGSNQHLPHDPVEFPLGKADLQIELASGGMLRATVLLPKQINEEPIGTLVPSPQSSLPDAMRQRLQTNGNLTEGRWQLTWPSLPPGTYQLEIGFASLPRPVVSVPEVVVPLPSEGDERLVDIDLSPLLRTVAVQLFAADGEPINAHRYVGIFLLPQDGEQELRGAAYWGKDTRVLLPREPVEVMVAAQGYRPRTVACGGDQLEVRLEPWPCIRLVFENLPPLPPELTLMANLSSESPSQRNYRTQWQNSKLAELVEASTHSFEVRDGRVELPIGEGPHKIEVSLRSKRGRTAIPFAAPTLWLTGGQVTVTLPAEAVAKAIAERQKADQQRTQNESRR